MGNAMATRATVVTPSYGTAVLGIKTEIRRADGTPYIQSGNSSTVSS